jgi:DnaJ-class molecular chaperone
MDQERNQRERRPAEQAQPADGQPTAKMNPGDQAPAGTPGTGENLCPVCSGEGSVDGQQCASCGGTGVVIQGVGGA